MIRRATTATDAAETTAATTTTKIIIIINLQICTGIWTYEGEGCGSVEKINYQLHDLYYSQNVIRTIK